LRAAKLHQIVPGTVLISLNLPQYNIPFLPVAPGAARRVVCKTADLTRSGFAIRIINEERD
jgi:hypothetical protein